MELSSFTRENFAAALSRRVRFCVELKRPHQLIDASKISAEGAAKLIGDFVRKNKIDILNVAGPRQSEWPEGYDYASRALSFSHGAVATDRLDGKRLIEPWLQITRNAALLPDRAAQRSTQGSAPRTNRLRRR